MGVSSGFDEVANIFAISGFKRCADPLTYALEMDKMKNPHNTSSISTQDHDHDHDQGSESAM